MIINVKIFKKRYLLLNYFFFTHTKNVAFFVICFIGISLLFFFKFSKSLFEVIININECFEMFFFYFVVVIFLEWKKIESFSSSFLFMLLLTLVAIIIKVRFRRAPARENRFAHKFCKWSSRSLTNSRVLLDTTRHSLCDRWPDLCRAALSAIDRAFWAANRSPP